MNIRVIRALIFKIAIVWSRSTFRAMDIFFWPLMDLLLWGFLTVYMLRVSSAVPSIITFLIGAIILWNVHYRAQQVVCLSFLEDVWSRNMLNIFTAPIRVSEYIMAAYFMGLLQAVMVMIILSLLAFLMYSFNILVVGLSLGALFVNLLLMGWALGLVTTGCIVRFGPPAEALAWAVPFLLQPVSAVFYPVSVLPGWLQPIALATPSSYVFEGMRQIMSGGGSPEPYLWKALGLNVIYLVVAGLIFNFLFTEARKKGLLAKYAA